MTIGGCFTCYTYRVTALGCLKKLRRKTELLTFDRFRLATFKMVTIHVAITILQTGAGSKLLDVLLDVSISSLVMNRAITLKLGHPYIWTTLPRAHWTYSTNLVHTYVRRLRGKHHQEAKITTTDRKCTRTDIDCENVYLL